MKFMVQALLQSEYYTGFLCVKMSFQTDVMPEDLRRGTLKFKQEQNLAPNVCLRVAFTLKCTAHGGLAHEEGREEGGGST
jgi:hypothetical protein